MTRTLIRHPGLILDDLFADFFKDPFPVIKRSTEGYPVTDIYVNDDGDNVIEMALAGFSKEDIKVEVKDNTVTIRCNAKTKEDAGKQRRIATRAFCKTFIDYYNKLDLMGANVTFENGLLSLTIPLLILKVKEPKLLEIK